jgi:RimJ/RimL family protein N-acetyltransferase
VCHRPPTDDTPPSRLAGRVAVAGRHDVDVAVLLSDDVVFLRRLAADDGDAWMAGDDADEVHWFAFPGPAPRRDVERALAVWSETSTVDGPVRHWAICVQDTGRLVGGVQLDDLGDGTIDVFSVVFPAWRRRGIATRACRLALAYAATAMGGRTARVAVPQGHAPAIALARRLGAAVTGMEVTAAGAIRIVLRLDLG